MSDAPSPTAPVTHSNIDSDDDAAPTPTVITPPIVQDMPPPAPAPRRSTRIPTAQQAEPSQLEKALQEVRESAERVKQAKVDRHITETSPYTNATLDPSDTLDDPITVLEAIDILEDEEPDITLDDDVPHTWEEAKRSVDAKRREAGFREELESLRNMKVYELIPRTSVPRGCKIRPNKPVFTLKHDENGIPTCWKVHVTFKGCQQVYGRDYTKTTSPTARMESWRILLHIATCLNWDAQQIDIKTAFLNGILPPDEIQYMEQPRHFGEKPDHVWKVVRSLYGMKQSGRIWNQTLNSQMVAWGFHPLPCEPCMYIRQTGDDVVIAAVHVDDFLTIASSWLENERLKQQMRQVWTISDLGTPPHLFGIGIQWHRNSTQVALSQTSLIDKIINKYNQSTADPVPIPMDPGLKLHQVNATTLSAEDKLDASKLPYRSLVGSLLYLAIGSRPDITYSMHQLSQFLNSYTRTHWQAAIRVVRYLKGTRDLKLYLGGNNFHLVGFTDSDWANCGDTRRSVGGYAFSLGSGIISWQLRKQRTVAASSCEAEYIAAFEAAKESTWLRSLLQQLNIRLIEPTTIFCNNNATITLSDDPSFHDCVKHIDIRYHFLRERVHSGERQLARVSTKENLADVFTKALEKNRFITLRTYLGLR